LIKGIETAYCLFSTLIGVFLSNQDRNDVTISVGMIELVPLLRRVSLAVDMRGGGAMPKLRITLIELYFEGIFAQNV
jgi:hypothetical protein